MTVRTDLGQIATAAFVSSISGMLIVVVILSLLFMLSSGFTLGVLVLGIGLFYGTVIALLTAWPLGCLVGWVVFRSRAPTGPNSALAGALTGVALILLVFFATLLEDSSDPGSVILPALCFALLGALSALAGYRLVLRSKPIES